INQLGYLPMIGETLEFRGLRLEVLEADERRVSRLRIQKLPPETATPSESLETVVSKPANGH
ncbi:MAG TPA: transporter associated domain-containing protein, partial [Blastocatellia bacterium]|nr:transporter associated domain-containing protein [Blastocatellia bacterium]